MFIAGNRSQLPPRGVQNWANANDRYFERPHVQQEDNITYDKYPATSFDVFVVCCGPRALRQKEVCSIASSVRGVGI